MQAYTTERIAASMLAQLEQLELSILNCSRNSGPTGIESDDKADLVTANAAAPSPIAPTAALLPKSADDEFLSADYISSQILVQTCPDRQGAASLLRQAD